MPQILRRRAVLHAIALGLILPWPAALLAHALPGTVLIFTPQDRQLSLTVTVPFDELALAMGDALEGPLQAGPLEPHQIAALATYFTDHMTIAQQAGQNLTVSVIHASTKPTTDDHLGTYNLIVVDFTAPLPPATLNLTLAFDAVMHHVRSHTATVYLSRAPGPAIGIGRIRPDPQSGLTAPFTFSIAP